AELDRRRHAIGASLQIAVRERELADAAIELDRAIAIRLRHLREQIDAALERHDRARERVLALEPRCRTDHVLDRRAAIARLAPVRREPLRELVEALRIELLDRIRD